LILLIVFCKDDEVLNDVYQWWVPPVRRLPPLLWKRLKEDLAGYLVEKGLGSVTLISWFHRQFKEAAQEEYLSGEALYVFYPPISFLSFISISFSRLSALSPLPLSIDRNSGDLRDFYLSTFLQISAGIPTEVQRFWPLLSVLFPLLLSSLISIYPLPHFFINSLARNRVLAKYFDGTLGTEERFILPQPLKYSEIKFNNHKISSLPYHQAFIDPALFHSSLYNLEFIEDKIRAEMPSELIRDYEFAVGLLQVSNFSFHFPCAFYEAFFCPSLFNFSTDNLEFIEEKIRAEILIRRVYYLLIPRPLSSFPYVHFHQAWVSLSAHSRLRVCYI
jgi:hypothetical protein